MYVIEVEPSTFCIQEENTLKFYRGDENIGVLNIPKVNRKLKKEEIKEIVEIYHEKDLLIEEQFMIDVRCVDNPKMRYKEQVVYNKKSNDLTKKIEELKERLENN